MTLHSIAPSAADSNNLGDYLGGLNALTEAQTPVVLMVGEKAVVPGNPLARAPVAITSLSTSQRPIRMPVDNFAPLASKGYGWLVPIVPPGADISPASALFRRPKAVGKAVGVKGRDGLWRGLDWLKLPAPTPADLEAYAGMEAGAGIRTGGQSTVYGIDVDALSPNLAGLIRATIAEIIGDKFSIRVGQAPKFLVPVRCIEPLSYTCVKFTGDDGRQERVELLADQRQFVALGVHPGTREPYSWPAGLPTFDDLPVLASETVRRLFARLAEVLPAAEVRRDALAPGSSHVPDQMALAGDHEAVARAVAALPNTEALFPTYDDYVRVGYAIKAALPGDEGAALALFQEWAGRYDGGADEPEVVEADFNRMPGPYRIGAGWLYEQAAKHSGGRFTLASAYFAPIADATFGAGPTEAGASEDWPEPEDIFGDGDQGHAPKVPRGAFPAVIESWAFDTAERLGVSPAFTAAAATAVVAAAIGTKQRIQPQGLNTEWTEPPILWVALIEEPGGKKSPVLAAASRPLSRLNDQRHAAWKRKHENWKQLKERARRSKENHDLGPEPKCERHTVDNFTVEALAGVLEHNTAGVLVNADELTGLIASLDQYKSKGSDRQLLLRLADGRSLGVDRVGAGATHVEHWGACVLGGIQPRKIKELAAAGLDADGLLQRFLPVLGDDERRRGLDRRPDEAAQKDYEDAIQHFVNAQHLPATVRLSAGALAVLRAFRQRVEDLRGLPNISDAWLGHLGKWDGLSARLLLVQHRLECWELSGTSGGDFEVTEETARRAARVADFFLAHSLRFYQNCVGLGPSGDDTRRIAGHILAHGPLDALSRRDIGQFDHSLRGSHSNDVDRDRRVAYQRVARAMENLERSGWCGPELAAGSSRVQWRINPKVFSRFQNRAEPARARADQIKMRIRAGRSARAHIEDNLAADADE